MDLQNETKEKGIDLSKKRRGFYKDGNGNVFVGYIKSESNMHYMDCGLLEHCLRSSDCEHLTPIDFEEGIRLWSEIRRKEFDKLVLEEESISKRREYLKNN